MKYKANKYKANIVTREEVVPALPALDLGKSRAQLNAGLTTAIPHIDLYRLSLQDLVSPQEEMGAPIVIRIMAEDRSFTEVEGTFFSGEKIRSAGAKVSSYSAGAASSVSAGAVDPSEAFHQLLIIEGPEVRSESSSYSSAGAVDPSLAFSKSIGAAGVVGPSLASSGSLVGVSDISGPASYSAGAANASLTLSGSAGGDAAESDVGAAGSLRFSQSLVGANSPLTLGIILADEAESPPLLGIPVEEADS